MSDIVIKAENLSKMYTIGHQTENGRYVALRDVLMRNARTLWSKTKDLATGKPIIQGDTMEEVWALKDVSFEIRRGEVVGIIGRNGAGKSTLLKVLSRITEPSAGRVTIKGRVASLLEVGTGFHPELTGRENIYLNGTILGMTREEIKRKFDEIVAFAEVETYLDTPVKRYSSGMYVRLAFAVAAHLEPEILIVDEVLAVGDAQFQKKCLGKMEKVGKEGRTVLFVSHNMGSINRLCSICMLLDKGRLVSNNLTGKVIHDYMFTNTDNPFTYGLPHDDNKEMQLRAVVLNPQKKERTAEVRYDEPIVIRVEYEVNAPVDNCTVWLALQTMDGVMAFCTSDYDMDLEMLEKRMPGYYKTDISIPEKWLNVGGYNIIVGIVKNHPLIVYNREETVTFSVLEVETPGSILQEGVRRGVFQPVLKWTNVNQ